LIDISGENMFIIENATIKDLFTLRQLEKECFTIDAWPLLDLAGVLTLPGIIRMKAVQEGQMVGFIAGNIGNTDGIGWISTIGVAKQARRQGIGKTLLAAFEDRINTSELRLTVRKSNLGAIQMYLQNGYQNYQIWENYYQGGEDGQVMRKLRAR
jgi:ribosomal protein S18 acetylase RimI-like enzyme